MENVRVFVEEVTHGDVQSEDVLPAGHYLYGDKGAPLSSGHESVGVESRSECSEFGGEFVELMVSCSVLQSSLS